MLDFEKKFHRSVSLLVAVHVAATFIIVFLMESLLPHGSYSVSNRMELRFNLDSLTRCLVLLNTDSKSPCTEEWSELIANSLDHVDALALNRTALLAIKTMSLDEITSQSDKRQKAIEWLREVALEFDRDSGQSLASYRAAVLTGTWTVAILSIGMLIFLSSFHRNTQSYLIKPVMEIACCLSEWKAGNKMRRCNSSEVSRDLQKIMDILNEFLDERIFPVKGNNRDQK